jgi:DNA-directed RNA polymerase omega subunit
MTTEAGSDRSALSSKYGLVIAVAKRAREIVDRREEPAGSGRKPVTMALDEIMRGEVIVTFKKHDAAPPLEVQDTPEDEDESRLSEPFL